MEFGFFAWIGIGLLVGILARFLVPGEDKMGIIWTILLGIGGALLGGYVAPMLGLPLHSLLWKIVAATGGAVVLVLIFRLIRR